MSDQAIAMLVVICALGGMIVLLGQVQRRLNPHPEVVRKLMHVSMGLLVLPFPWAFGDQAWMVVALAALAIVLMLCIRWIPAIHERSGKVLHAVGRQSFGELCYPAAVAALYVLADGQLLGFVIPMLVLTLADAVAALIGVGYGRLRYAGLDGIKSVEGSVAFFTVAFLSAHVPLLLFTTIGREEVLLIAIIIGLLVMMIEAVSWRGLDNLFIPLLTYALLEAMMPLPVDALRARAVVLVLLMVFVLLWRRRSTLNVPAMIGGTLFGYTCWVITDIQWLPAPMLLFLMHALYWPRNLRNRNQHDLITIIAVTAPAVFWMLVHLETGKPASHAAYVTVFAGQLAFVGVSWIDPRRSHLSQWLLTWLWAVAGWILIFLPSALLVPSVAWRLAPSPRIAEFTASDALLIAVSGLVALTLAAALFNLSMRWFWSAEHAPERLHWLGAACAATGSLALIGALSVMAG
ncbi:MAG: hypothetical protein JJU36_03210 [Phycisphaeraceae bacterium]|nr:hypothetical protein [Phycisphaeraceae bacterium]